MNSDQTFKWVGNHCFSLAEKEIHIWRVNNDIISNGLGILVKVLSEDELAKSERFYFEKDRRQFIISRSILRRLLGNYLDEAPEKLGFEYTSNGKPKLASGCRNIICFNLSHSHSYTLFAFALHHDVGIDVEWVLGNIKTEDIASRFFSPDEIEILDQTPPKDRKRIFFQFWTRKEAFLKAIGSGLTLPLNVCDVSTMTGNTFSPMKTVGNLQSNGSWFGMDLFPAQDYTAAVVIEGGEWNIRYWQMNHIR